MQKLFVAIQIGLYMFISACSAATESVSSSTATLTITKPPTPTPSLVPVYPTSTSTFTPQPTSTSTPAPPTTTPLPTLLPSEQAKLELEFISTNGGCNLPCWWGIHPSVSIWQTLDDVYAYWRTGVTPEPPRLSTMTPMPDIQKSTGIYIGDNWCYALLDVEDNGTGIIQTIQMTVERPATYGRENCAKALRPYFLDNLLIEYGQPSRVLMEAHAVTFELGAPRLYDLWLFYDDLGVLAHYEGEHELSQGVIQICPQYDKVWRMGLYLRAAGHPLTLEETSGYFDRGLSAEYIRPIEEATDLTVESFHQKFAIRDVQRCFETSASLWQEP